MTASDLVESFSRRGIHLSASDGRLVVDTPAGGLTDEDRATLRSRKAELLAVLDPYSIAERDSIRAEAAGIPIPIRPATSPTHGYTRSGQVVELAAWRAVDEARDPLMLVAGEGWPSWYPAEDADRPRASPRRLAAGIER